MNIFPQFRFGHQYLQNCHKLFCDAVSAKPAFNLKLCLKRNSLTSLAKTKL